MAASVLFPKFFTEEALDAYLFLKCPILSLAFWPPYFLFPLCLGHFSSCSASFHSPGWLLFSLRLLSEPYPIGENSDSSIQLIASIVCSQSCLYVLHHGAPIWRGHASKLFPCLSCLSPGLGIGLVGRAQARLSLWAPQRPPLSAGVDMGSNYCLPSTPASAKTLNDEWDTAWDTKDNGGRVRTRCFPQLASFLRKEWCWEGHHGAKALNYDGARNRSWVTQISWHVGLQI